MKVRDYAKACGVKVVGKLTRKIDTFERYNPATGDTKLEKTVYWVDEAGNDYYNEGLIITTEGGVI